jgi:heptosyltransferase-2
VNTPRHEQGSPTGGRILVIRGGAIGDFILTLPAIAALRRQFPETHLEVLGYPHIVQLALAGGLVDRVESIEARAMAGFFARHGDLAENLADYFSEFDLIISYLYDPDGIFRTNIARCSPAQFIQGPHRPDEAAGIPASQVYLKPLERLAIFGADPVPRLSIQGRPARVRSIALHPGSGSTQKNWPEGRWSELVGHIMDQTDRDLLLVGGEAEGERLQRLGAALPPARVRVAQSLPLAELAGLLERCCGFVGHDSGISHLASALGLPGLVLWGHTVEAVWRPPADRIRILRAPGGLATLRPTVVFEHLQQLIQTD